MSEKIVKLTYRLSEATAAKIDRFAAELGVARSEIVEKAIDMFSSSGEEKCSSVEGTLELLKIRTSALEKSSFSILNLLNSLAANLGYEQYESAEKNPCRWLLESNKEYHALMVKRKTDKIVKKR